MKTEDGADMNGYKKIKQQTGFTLVELIAVLALIAILFAFAMPVIQQCFVQLQMDTVIVQLHRDIRWAQRLADQHQKTVNIHFLRTSPAYQYGILLSGESQYMKKVYLPEHLTRMTAQSIIIEPDRSFRKNGHVMLQKGEIRRYVYYYQTGRSRVTSVAE